MLRLPEQERKFISPDTYGANDQEGNKAKERRPHENNDEDGAGVVLAPISTLGNGDGSSLLVRFSTSVSSRSSLDGMLRRVKTLVVAAREPEPKPDVRTGIVCVIVVGRTTVVAGCIVHGSRTGSIRLRSVRDRLARGVRVRLGRRTVTLATRRIALGRTRVALAPT
jgi:hypothetical protein